MTTQELKQRTFQFGVRVVNAVGANYRAAARARSRADFVAKLGIVEEECDESSYWMEMIIALKLLKKGRLTNLLTEANELLAIVVAFIKTARRSRRA